MGKFIGQTGLVYLWSKVKTWVGNFVKITEVDGVKTLTVGNITVTLATKTSQLTNDAGFITASDVPEGAAPSTTTPKMDGTAAVGSETAFARGDHRHPTDTSRQAAITSSSKLSADLISDGTTNKTVTATEKTTWSGKQDAINDLSDIRNGASAGATAYQKPNGGIPSSDMASAVQTQLTAASNAIPSSQKGVANGVATLGSDGKVPSSQLPSYVDDVVEAYIRSGQTALSSTWLATGSASGTVITPESGVIYMIMNGNDTYPTNSEYRWGGTAYVPIYDGGATEMTTAEMDTATNNWT